jgi:hypothetical protein
MHRVEQMVANDSNATVEFGLEPWGMYLSLPPGASFTIVAQSTTVGDLEVVRGDSIVVYAWPGSTLKVYSGDRLVHEQSVAVPQVPAGMSVRDFMAIVGLDEVK